MVQILSLLLGVHDFHFKVVPISIPQCTFQMSHRPKHKRKKSLSLNREDPGRVRWECYPVLVRFCKYVDPLEAVCHWSRIGAYIFTLNGKKDLTGRRSYGVLHKMIWPLTPQNVLSENAAGRIALLFVKSSLHTDFYDLSVTLKSMIRLLLQQCLWLLQIAPSHVD